MPGPTQFPVQPEANAGQRITGGVDVVIAIELIMVEVRIPPGIGLLIKCIDQVVRCTLHQVIVHRCNVRIDLLRDEQVIMDRVGFFHRRPVGIIKTQVRAGIHAIGFQQAQLRLEFTQLGRTHKRQCLN